MKKLLIYFPVLVLLACGGNKDEQAENPETVATAPLAKSQNSDAFNTSFEKMLGDYFLLKEGMVRSTSSVASSVDSAANALIASTDSLKLKEIKADEAIVSTAQSYAQGISAEAKALVGEKDLQAKRKAFQMISDQMYDLVRTVRYDRQVVYHQYCPMAFNDEGAYWLSNNSEIMNPYFGNKMLHCGEVRDSLDFRVK
jgi:hypothetical protein